MTQAIQTKLTGKSFNLLSNCPYFEAKKAEPLIFKIDNKPFTAGSSAQLFTLAGYGDNSGLRTRNLQWKAETEDFNDLKDCINIISSYNEFEAKTVLKKAYWRLNVGQFWNEDNPNNGKNLFRFEIGREYSPVIYVHYNELFGNKIVKDTDEQPATQTEEAKKIIYWEEYNGADFIENMTKLAEEMKADEFKITEHPLRDKKHYTARFWWD